MDRSLEAVARRQAAVSMMPVQYNGGKCRVHEVVVHRNQVKVNRRNLVAE